MTLSSADDPSYAGTRTLASIKEDFLAALPLLVSVTRLESLVESLVNLLFHLLVLAPGKNQVLSGRMIRRS